MSQNFVIRSSVDPQLKRSKIIKGTLLALLGSLLLFSGFSFLSKEQFETWGGAIFAIGFLIISFGLIPYRRLCLLEKNPSKLIVTHEFLQYQCKKYTSTLALTLIKELEFVKGKMYGIRIKINIISEDQEEEIFFPYFSKKAFYLLENILEKEKET